MPGCNPVSHVPQPFKSARQRSRALQRSFNGGAMGVWGRGPVGAIAATARCGFWPPPVLGPRLHAPGRGAVLRHGNARRLRGSVGMARSPGMACVRRREHRAPCLAAAALDGKRRPRADPLQISLRAVSFQPPSRKPGSPPSRHRFGGVAVPGAGESSQKQSPTSRLEPGCTGDHGARG